MLARAAGKLARPLINVSFQVGRVIKSVRAREGATILEAAHANGVRLLGACEGSLACSTCHVVLDEKSYRQSGAASEREEDLLDQAKGLTLTSRLGCQVKIGKMIENACIRVPEVTFNIGDEVYRGKKPG